MGAVNPHNTTIVLLMAIFVAVLAFDYMEKRKDD